MTAGVPLSFAQRRLWLLHQVTGGGPAYNVAAMLRLRGRLDRAALTGALADVVARHEPLRTVVVPAEDGAYQLVRPADPPPTVPVREIPPAGLATEIARVGAHRFDLTADRPVHAELFATDPDEHVLALALHHIACDGWSLGPLLRDLASAYRARTNATAPDWPPLPTRYREYAARQSARPDGAALDHWRDTLAGLPEELALPADRPRPPVASHRGGRVGFTVDAALGARLAALARSHRVTLFMVLQAALAVLLTRLGAGTDLPLGTVVAGRTDVALDDLVGLFVNTVVLRTDTSGDPTVAELLRRVRRTDLAAFGHQDVPFERVVEALAPARSAGRHPLFQTALTLETVVPGRLELPGLEATCEPVALGTAKFDLSFIVAAPEGDGRLDGAIEYAADLFDPSTVRDLAARFLRVLEAVTADPGRRLSRIDILEPVERERILGWSGRGAGAALTGRFAAVAAAHHDRVALRAGTTELSYAELDRWANRLAHRLLALGVRAEEAVGVLVERSATPVVASLGVVKAGGCYVPIAPGLPVERVRALRTGTGFRVMVTDRAMAGRPVVADLAAAGVRVVEVDGDEVTAGDGTDPGLVVEPDRLACVLYTSGSAGVPKGVAVTHAGVVSLATDRAFAGWGRERVLLQAPYAFDASTFEIWVPLLAGAEIAVAPAGPPDPAGLARMLGEAGVTVALLTTALFNVMAEQHADAIARLREVWSGGEAASRPAMARTRDHAPATRLINVYGPTEATTMATYQVVGPAELARAGVPIGRPMDDRRGYVLDADLVPVPPGVTGELYLGGAGLARGYLAQPGATAHRFVADPFGRPGARMYRTGDRARWTPAGALEFAGRVDDQVKIRGVRVEPGEVEAAVRRLPGVARGVAVVREDRPGERRIVAYVVAGPAFDVRAARAALAGTLPDHLVPSAVVAVGELPLTATGKVDRAALPAPAVGPDGGRPPRTERERLLAGLFAQALGVDRIGLDDDFFELGGHSLLATQLVGRVRRVLGVELPAAALFDAPTVAGVDRLAARAGPARPPLRRVEHTGAVELSFAQRRLWFLHQLDGASPAYHVPAALRLTGRLDRSALAAALADLAARHEVLRTRVVSVDGRAYQRVSEPEPVLSVAPVGAAGWRAAVAELAAAGFDLAAEAPWRARLLAVGNAEHVLVLVLHHIACDGRSLAVLLRDLAAAYAARLEGAPPAWAPLPVRYRDYAVWQRELMDGAGPQLAFWRAALDGLPDELTLPASRPRPAVASHRGDRVTLRLDAALHARLREVAAAHDVTLFMVLQAALAALLTRLGAGTDIPVGTAVAGRTDEALDDLVGFFVNTLVLRTDTSGDPTFAELLRRVRRFDLAAYSHQDVPFERVVAEIDPARDAARHPLFQTMLTMPTTAPDTVTLPGLVAEIVPAGPPAAKFDLLWSVQEEAPGAVVELQYATDLFDRGDAELLLERFARLLAGAVAGVDRPISRLPVLGPAEYDRVIHEYNRTVTGGPAGDLASLLLATAARRGTAVAVVAGDEAVSYAVLYDRARRVAARLRGLGAGPESVVAVCAPRSVELVVGLLGAVLAGAAYLALDPEYPAQRLRFMVADTGPACVLSVAGVAVPGDLPVLRLDDPAEWAAAPAAPPAPVHPDTVAYVVYTSGSTGVPKGVANTHRGIVNRLAWSGREFGLGPGDVVLQKAPAGFDVSVWEVFGTLLAGARLVLARPGGHRDPEYLRDLIASHGVTVVHFVPSMLAAFLGVPGLAAAGRSLRLLLSGGEELPAGLARRCVEVLPGAALANLYGPAEAAVDVSGWRCDPAVLAGRARVPIGGPISGVTLYVLDDRLAPVPVGVAGELYLGGAGLARGYTGRPGLTAARFVADPYGPPGGRLYASGDLARWTPGGAVEYLGRRDDQVKIRGFRVEPGEIEAALAALPGVDRAAVVVREDRPGTRRIVAYVAGSGPEPAALRDALAARLPAYLVPSEFVVLDALPLQPNGKLDRRRLPAPPERRPAGAPATAAERLLCDLAAGTLGLTAAGPDDNFFALGGDSILAIQLVSRARAAGLGLTTQDIFTHGTLAELAAAARPAAAAPAVAPAAAPPAATGDSGEVWPLTPLQEGFLFHALLDQDGPDLYTAQLCAELTGPVDADRLRRAVAVLLDRHPNLRAGFRHRADGQPIQVVPARLPVPLHEIDATGTDLAALLAAERAHRFDPAEPPLLRLTLARFGPQRYQLLFSHHHLLLDGWSLPGLLSELFHLYERGGDPAGLPPVMPYRAYLDWLTAQDRDAAAEAWTAALHGLPGPTRLRPGQPDQGPVAERSTWLPASLTADLRRLARARRLTLNTVCQAAWGVLLARLTGRDDVVFGTTVSGRPPEVAGVERMVGLFINTVPVRVTPLPEEPVAELLERLRAEQAGLLPHRHLGLAEIQRGAGHGELFDTVLIFDNYPLGAGPPAVLADGVRVAFGPVHSVTHYPLALTLRPLDDRLYLRAAYRTGALDEPTVDGIVDAYREVLAAMAADPARPAGTLRPAALPALAAVFRPAPVRAVAVRREPRPGRESDLAVLFADVLDRPGIGPDDDFFDHGGHSVLAVRLVNRIRAALGVRVPISLLIETRSAARLAERLDAAPPADGPLDVLLPIAAGGDRAPLFCFHPVSGLAAAYTRLAGVLGPGQPIYGLQLYGLTGARPLPDNLDALLDGYLAAMRTVAAGGPYRLLGWSLGGRLAQVAAARLCEAGETVQLLALLDARPGGLGRRGQAEAAGRVAASLARDPLLRDHAAPALEAILNVLALLDREPARPYAGDAVLFRAAAGEGSAPGSAAWRSRLTGHVEVHDVPAGHDQMLEPAAVAAIAPILRARLDRPDSPSWTTE